MKQKRLAYTPWVSVRTKQLIRRIWSHGDVDRETYEQSYMEDCIRMLFKEATKRKRHKRPRA